MAARKGRIVAEHSYDLVIVGAGSGNMLPTKDFAEWRIAVVESHRFGGTCLNRGCIPSKILVHTPDVAREIQQAGRFGVRARWDGANWPEIRDRVFGRVDPVHERAVAYRRRNGADVFVGEARFVAPKVLSVGADEIRAERFVLATGSRPSVPPIDGLAETPYLTSDTVMRLDKLPGSMIVLGGGFIAAEMSHIFGSLGTRVTIATRGQSLLSQHDTDVRTRFTDLYRERFDVKLGATAQRVNRTRKGVRVSLNTATGPQTAEAETLLIATGRTPNSDRLGVAAAGIETDAHGHVKTDDTYATNVPGIWAFGDLANHFQLKHMANAEARLVRHNLLHPYKQRRAAFTVCPSAVFADPQVASVGATEQDLHDQGRPYSSAIRQYGETAYGWALEDTSGFVKVFADPDSRLLLGAHIMGPQAATLIQPVIRAMCFGNTADELARDVLYIHPALTEAIEQACLNSDLAR
jgi:mycothione reductase